MAMWRPSYRVIPVQPLPLGKGTVSEPGETCQAFLFREHAGGSSQRWRLLAALRTLYAKTRAGLRRNKQAAQDDLGPARTTRGTSLTESTNRCVEFDVKWFGDPRLQLSASAVRCLRPSSALRKTPGFRAPWPLLGRLS